MGKSDTIAPGMDRDDMKRLFRAAREQPVQAAMALGPDREAVLLMDKRKPGRSLDREMRQDTPGSREHRYGTVIIDKDDPKLALFTVDKAVSGLARKLVKAVRGSGVTKISIMLANGTLCEAAEDEDAPAPDGETAGETAPEGPPAATGPDTAALTATLTSLVQRIAAAIAANPSQRDLLLGLAGKARDLLKAGDPAGAEDSIESLAGALEPPSATADGRRFPALAESLPEQDEAPPPASTPPLTLVGYTPDAQPAPPAKQAPKPATVSYQQFTVYIPKNMSTLDEMYRLFERTAFGREMNLSWECKDFCNMAKNRGTQMRFKVPTSLVDANTDPAQTKRQAADKAALGGVPGAQKAAIQTEADRRYILDSGERPGADARAPGTGQARQYDRALSSVMRDREMLQKLPPELAALLGGKDGEYDPKNYAKLQRIADKLKAFSPDDLKLYKSLPIRATDNLDVFEASIDLFLARKAELAKAQPPGQPSSSPPAPGADAWKDFGSVDLAAMSEDQREELARSKANELATAQLKHMAEHPGEALEGFAKSATLVNTGETMGAIGKDISEAANGDANAFARLGAGAGAGAKLSGWLMAVAGVLYVASWATGVGELATIAAAGAIMLGANLTLSVAESELRIKAASQSTDPEEFKHNVEAAAAARANVALCVALIVIAAVLHFTAKALFPEQLQKLNTSLKNLREKIRLKGSVHDLKPGLMQDMTARKADLAKAAEAAKAHAADTARTLDGLSTEQFVERLEKGGAGGFLDNSKIPAEQKVNFRELLKSEEGRHAIDTYKQKLVQALRTDVTAHIESLARQYIDGVDTFMKEADAAQNHDDLQTAASKLETVLGEEHAKQFMKGEQDKLVQQKLQEVTADVQKEVAQAPATAATKRVTERIAAAPDPAKFKVTYTPDEVMAILKKAKDLGLPDKMAEDLIFTASREAKRISAADLMTQMDNWTSTVSKRGYPFKFKNAEEFAQFGHDLKGELGGADLPTDDVRVQGSSLRKPTADDVDLAVVVDAAKFDELLLKRYDNRIAFSDKAPTPKAKIKLAGLSHAELVELANDIARNGQNYNSTADTFRNALQNGMFNSMSDINPALKAARRNVAAKYPDLNVKTISVMVKGSAFDLTPDLPIEGK